MKELNLYDLFNSIEMPLLKVLSKMELEGINLDVQMLQSYSIELREEILSIEKQIYKLSGVEFNISSLKQLGEVL